jgi:hypothetical protein
MSLNLVPLTLFMSIPLLTLLSYVCSELVVNAKPSTEIAIHLIILVLCLNASEMKEEKE